MGDFNVFSIISHRILYVRIDLNTTNVCDNINSRSEKEIFFNDFASLFFVRTP